MSSNPLITRVGQVIASVLLLSAIACSPSQQSTGGADGSESSQVTVSPNLDGQPISSNLVALFVVKKDNLNDKFRGEIYPIALLLNDRYLDVSSDVTQEMRDGVSHDRVLQLNDQRIVVNAVRNFTVISDNQKLGEFQVEAPNVSQFSCSSIITGQGTFQGQTALPTLFEQLPQERSGGFSGVIRNQKFDQTWRTTIAISQPRSTSQPPATSEADLAQYRQDALTIGKTAIAQVSRGTPVPGEATVESIQVVDLEQDGSPELFAQVRQGNTTTSEASQQRTPTGFAAVWFRYQAGKPQLLETTQASVSLTESHPPYDYDLLGAIDIDGDGNNEVIMQRTGYESISFEIYNYKNHQLDRVFNGAGYGC